MQNVKLNVETKLLEDDEEAAKRLHDEEGDDIEGRAPLASEEPMELGCGFAPLRGHHDDVHDEDGDDEETSDEFDIEEVLRFRLRGTFSGLVRLSGDSGFHGRDVRPENVRCFYQLLSETESKFFGNGK